MLLMKHIMNKEAMNIDLSARVLSLQVTDCMIPDPQSYSLVLEEWRSYDSDHLIML
jgi:hypothetical protein